MGLSSYSKKGVDSPILTCDSCGKSIWHVRLAIITFPELSGHPVSNASGIYHKGKCDPSSSVTPYSEELAEYMPELMWNIGIGEKQISGSKRRLVIEMPEPDAIMNGISKPPW